ncbi:helix-turn-helix domain-containing protein [Azohydromonas lata]|uniref:Helix-turn-helix transcriptional regulator n=1 Tax=Azohydromonas lata TaxID=45677 RepID=A0ABU5I8A4_9BURK|nr:helix-turn-helix transcriptional regulator [Azohydromonas lata]MDZ5455079.1 helix-turn-helix transcriptional regulator [Azohydromonas lata]
MKRRDSSRDRGRAQSSRAPMRDDVVLQIGANGRSEAPRQSNFKPPVPKQGVNGALRAANLRLLLDKAPVREALALVAEVPLERLEVMSKGGLCPDETAFHIEKTLKLPGKWLDGLNREVPERTLELLKHPEKAGLNDDDVDDEAASVPAVAAAAAPSRSASATSALPQPMPSTTKPAVNGASAQHGQVVPIGSAASAKAAQGTLSLVADNAPSIASDEDMKATRTPAAQAAKPTTASAAVEPRPSVTAARSKSAPKADRTAPTPELRQRNLSLLLQGKGSKSAMARVIGISQPYMSTIANGGKVLDQDFCRNIAQALGMPEDWFEAPRTVADIPAVALRRLAPLPRGKGAGADTTLTSDTAPAQATEVDTAERAAPKAGLAAAHPSEAATAATGTTEERAVIASVPSEQTGVQEKNPGRQSALQGDNKQRGNTTGPAWDAARMAAAAPVQADLLSTVEPEVGLSAPAVPPAPQADVIAAPSKTSNPELLKAAVAAAAPQTLPAARDIALVSAPPLILEGGLAPITEALIKILALKDRQGALSEDKAFELLGAVRVL